METGDNSKSKITFSRVHWGGQICCILITITIFSIYLAYHLITVNHAMKSDNATVSLDWLMCMSEPFDPWMKTYMLPIVGACIGQAFALSFRALVSLHGYSSENKLRHPSATVLMIVISTIQAVCITCCYLDIIPTTCVDFLGVKTHFFLWAEWLCTVPYMFFLVNIMDVKRQCMRQDDIFIQLLGGGSLVLFFTNNFLSIPNVVHWTTFIIGNVMMAVALAWQQLQARGEYRVAKSNFDKLVTQYESTKAAPHTTFHSSSSNSEAISTEVALNNTGESQAWPTLAVQQAIRERTAYDTLCVTECKHNTAVFMTICFVIIPLFYFANALEWIDDESSFLCTYLSGYLTKILFMHIVTDSHVEILDPNKFLIIEERRKAEESRLMFMRYVFHEVRVPLNSVVLGLQLLQDNRKLARMEKETLTMMKDATSFMAETMNDVLSLQKIENGMLELELKPFSPKRLVSSVVSNFR